MSMQYDDGGRASAPRREFDELVKVLAVGCTTDILFALGLRPAGVRDISKLLKLKQTAVRESLSLLTEAGLVKQRETDSYEHADGVTSQLLGNRIRVTIRIDDVESLTLESPMG